MHDERMTRRQFIRRALAGGLAAYGLAGLPGMEGPAEAAAAPTIAVAGNRKPAELVRAAINGLGGISKFVTRGNLVVVKPNMSWARKPDQAATTNPEVVAEIVRLCRGAGAREVRVIDHILDAPDATVLRLTAIQQAAEAAGARVISASSMALYQRMTLKRGKVLKVADVLRDLVRADVFINVPIAKVHGSTTLTLGLKNLMGVVWDRGAWHASSSLDQCIADFAAHIKPDLVVLDAARTLMSNGPKGPGRIATPNLVVAGTDQLAVDAYGAKIMGRKPEEVGHLRLAASLGVGELRLDRIRVKNV